MQRIRLLTRGSALALAQSRWVAERLRAAHPGLEIELRTVCTRGDQVTDVPISEVGGKGVFVKEIEDALRNGQGDIAVHSLKDMTSAPPDGLTIGAVPQREDPSDALVLPGGAVLREGRDGLPVAEGGRVGTSSLRRRAQLLAWRPDLSVETLRGNLDTRLRKLDAGEYDAIVLAAAGLRRLGLEQRISLRLPVSRFVPAVGQGALAVQARRDDTRVLALLEVLEHAPTRACVTAERAFLARLEGDCRLPLAALATCEGDELRLEGLLADPDGTRIVRDAVRGRTGEAIELGERLAGSLLAAGGAAVRAYLHARRDGENASAAAEP